MEKKNSMDEKFKKDKLAFARITNEDLICKDCQSRFDDTVMPCNTSKCEAYTIKPDKVLDGGDCVEYKKER